MARLTDPLLTLPDTSGVLYLRLYQRMRALILDGSWATGMRVPSSRRLASDLGISRNTASLALEQLLADGWIKSRSRSGMFVSADVIAGGRSDTAPTAPAQSSKPPVPFEMSPGSMDVFPIERWARLQSRVWSGSAPYLLYEHDRAGDSGLRKAIADVVAPARGMRIDPDEIVIVTGTQGALDLVALALKGGTAVVEDPGYIPGQAVLSARGMKLAHLTVDGEGMDVPKGRESVSAPSLVMVSPSLHFPTCVSMSSYRRAALLDWADETGAWIFEDDYDAQSRFDETRAPIPLREERKDRVVTSVTFNRLLYRSLRLGFMIVPSALRERVLAFRGAVDEYVNLPNQLVLRQFIEEGGFTAHVRRSRDAQAERREALVELLRPYLGSVFEPKLNGAGLHLVLRPMSVSAEAIATAFRSFGMECTTLAQLSRLSEPREGVLLGFAAFSPDLISAFKFSLDRAITSVVGA